MGNYLCKNQHTVLMAKEDEHDLKYWKDRFAKAEPIINKNNYKALKRHFRTLDDDCRTPRTVINHLMVLTRFATAVHKPFTELDKDDLDDYFDSLDLAKSSIKLHKATIRSFLRSVNPDVAEKIKAKSIKNTLTPSDLITFEEIEQLITAAEHFRDKALIACYFDSGGRKNEILSTLIKDATFDNYGCKLYLRESKTFERTIRLTYAAPYLADWLECHPRSNDQDAFIFCSLRTPTTVMSRSALYHVIDKVEAKSGIKKRPNPRRIRHSRATHLVKRLNGNEQKLKLIMGWLPNSSMAGTYVHLSGEDDIDDMMLQAANIKKETEEEEKPLTYKCSGCGTLNPVTRKRCRKCGFSENDKVVTKDDLDEIREELEQMKMIKDVFIHAQTLENENLRQSFAALAKMIVEDEQAKTKKERNDKR
jgi:integrase/recombinase XerD